jgi:hypothetical protein
MIHFIPNDPLCINDVPMRRIKPRANRSARRAGVTVSGAVPESVYQPDEPEFVHWQARQAAIAAVEAWEEALDAPIKSWARESANPRSLRVIHDKGEDINAYYDRRSVSFFHKFRDGKMMYSGASTDTVAHEVGHAILDAIRPDLWAVPTPEIAAFHEAFGDVTAIITALFDRRTRVRLIDVTPDLATPNFVEATLEDLSDTVRRVLGSTDPASKPRRALNTFQWRLPETMPDDGGPDDMINEAHSIARIITGCFYDLLRLIFVRDGPPTPARLWAATCTAGSLFYEAARTAPIADRFFRSIGQAMVLTDEADNDGVHRDLIERAFNLHGVPLGADSFLAPELGLAGDSPSINRRTGAVAVERATLRDLRERLGAPLGRPDVRLLELAGNPVANVEFHDEVPLDAVDERLRGVVAPVPTVALIGQSGGSAALLFAPRFGGQSTEVISFVRSLVRHDQVALDSVYSGRAAIAPSLGGGVTHAIRRRAGKRELHRIRFACACAETH